MYLFIVFNVSVTNDYTTSGMSTLNYYLMKIVLIGYVANCMFHNFVSMVARECLAPCHPNSPQIIVTVTLHSLAHKVLSPTRDCIIVSDIVR
jgi:hypothetical protein